MTGPDSGGEACARCGLDPVSHAYPGSPAYRCVYVFPPAPTVPDNAELREAIAACAWIGHRRADLILALPEVAALLAERDEAVRQVAAVREVVSRGTDQLWIVPIRRALGDLP